MRIKGYISETRRLCAKSTEQQRHKTEWQAGPQCERKGNIMKKRAAFTFSVIAGVLAAAMTISAAPISKEDAQKKALEAVGLTEDQVIFKATETDTDDGRQIYEIDFFIPGETKYEFDIDINTGAIVEQDIDLWEADDDVEYADLIKAAADKTKEAVKEVAEKVEGEISDLQAKAIALKDAGFKADEVTVTKCRRDLDDGTWQFEIEMKLADGTEYDYEIKASDGKILDKDVDFDD